MKHVFVILCSALSFASFSLAQPVQNQPASFSFTVNNPAGYPVLEGVSQLKRATGTVGVVISYLGEQASRKALFVWLDSTGRVLASLEMNGGVDYRTGAPLIVDLTANRAVVVEQVDRFSASSPNRVNYLSRLGQRPVTRKFAEFSYPLLGSWYDYDVDQWKHGFVKAVSDDQSATTRVDYFAP